MPTFYILFKFVCYKALYLQWERLFMRIILCIFSLLFLASCSNTEQDSKQIEQNYQSSIHLKLEANDNLDSIMDKIFESSVYKPEKDVVIKDLLPKQSQAQMLLNPQEQIPQLESKLYDIAKAYEEAYSCNKQMATHNCTNISQQLSQLLRLNKAWGILSQNVQEYKQMPVIDNFHTQITLSLSMLMLDFDSAKDGNLSSEKMSGFNTLLNAQMQYATSTGELNKIVQSHIQYKLLALYAMQNLDKYLQRDSSQDDIRKELESSIAKDLEQYKDFLNKDNIRVYNKAFSLLQYAALTYEEPIDKVLEKLYEYPKGLDLSIEDSGIIYEHIDWLNKAYYLFKNNLLLSNEKDVQEIIHYNESPLKNVYSTEFIANYIYGLDYLALAFADYALIDSINSSISHMQKEFRYFQVVQHRFVKEAFHNYLSSMILSAYALSSAKKYPERFIELKNSIKSELDTYIDSLSKQEINLYKDALELLDSTNLDEFATLQLGESRPKDEEGYVKIKLNLAPQEHQRVMNLASKIDSDCLSLSDIGFMLSLAYQAFKIQGYEGIASEFLAIRLGDVFDIQDLSITTNSTQKLNIFDGVGIMAVADSICENNTQEKLRIWQDKLTQNGKICGRNIYIGLDNALILSELSPKKVLEILPDGSIYFRLALIDLYLNTFLFTNSQLSLNKLTNAIAPQDNDLIALLLQNFPAFKSYLNTRLSKLQADEFINNHQKIICDSN